MMSVLTIAGAVHGSTDTRASGPSWFRYYRAVRGVCARPSPSCWLARSAWSLCLSAQGFTS